MKEKISVFIASPGDVPEERQLIRDITTDLNKDFGDGANVEFEAVGWEDLYPHVNMRVQGVINEKIDNSDVFILIMNKRWGQDYYDHPDYTSYTEEEFFRAYERNKKESSPAILTYFKEVISEDCQNPDDQLIKVLDFKKQLEDLKTTLYGSFQDKASFTDKINSALRAYVKNELPKPSEKYSEIVPSGLSDEMCKIKSELDQVNSKLELANNESDKQRERIKKIELESAIDTTLFAQDGYIKYANSKFSVLLNETENLTVLSMIFTFFRRIGEMDKAKESMEKWQKICDKTENQRELAGSLTNFGCIYTDSGDYKSAEKMFLKALEIDKKYKNYIGTGISYLHLGTLNMDFHYDLSTAKTFLEKSLSILIDSNEILSKSSCFSNLAILYRHLKEYKKSELMSFTAISILMKVDCKVNISSVYEDLAILYRILGDFKKSEKFHYQSILINNEVGNKLGLSISYNNLSSLYIKVNSIEKAKEICEESLAINNDIRNQRGVSYSYSNLGVIYERLGLLDEAEYCYKRSISIKCDLGLHQDLSVCYFNLGNLYFKNKNYEDAENMYYQSLELDRRYSDSVKVAESIKHLGGLYFLNGKIAEAAKLYVELRYLEGFKI